MTLLEECRWLGQMEPPDAHKYLKRLKAGRWFNGLPEALQGQIVDAAVPRALPAGALLFARGDPPSGLYGILDGAIRITTLTEDGKEALLTLAEPPTWLGEIAVFDGQPRTHDAVADVDSLVLQIPQPVLDRILTAEPRYWRDLGLLLASKLRLTFIAMEDIALAPISIRLALRLVMMAEGYGEWHDRNARIVEVSQEQLAMMLTTSRQTVNQQLKALEGRGVIKVAYGQIEILDLPALKALTRAPE